MNKFWKNHPLETSQGLYSPTFERENCGFGMIANLDNTPSHKLVQTAIKSLSRMKHRGGLAADGCSGDGCGLLLSMPEVFFKRIAQENNIQLTELFAVGMVFLNNEKSLADQAKQELTLQLKKRGLSMVRYVSVRVCPEVLGEQALENMPNIEYVFVNASKEMDTDHFNRQLFVARRFTEMQRSEDEKFYVVTLNAQTIGYKGLVVPSDLPKFFPDLNEEDFISSVCSYHQRFSTNTLPQWRLAQPFRFLAHNGELNTIDGNRIWANARRSKMNSPILPEVAEFDPLVSMTGSDSASLDNMLEIFMMGGSDIFRTLKLLIPPAWQNVNTMDEKIKLFFEFHSMHMEPWDGPAGLVIHNGEYAICALDRNGLRPTRYVITKDRNITFASEVGVYDYAASDIIEKGRVKAGQMVAVDLKSGQLLTSEDIDKQVLQNTLYFNWVKSNVIDIHADHKKDAEMLDLDSDTVHTAQKLFQVTFEERDQVIRVLAEDGQETTASMGDDAPLPVMSMNSRSLFDYFRQVFAQVTNPAIDSLRETIVMSLQTSFGSELSLFEKSHERSYRIVVDSPVLSPQVYHDVLKATNAEESLGVAKLSMLYDPSIGLESAVENLTDKAVDMVKAGKVVLLISDRDIEIGQLTMHAAIAVGAVHHRLIKEGLRTDANLLVETGSTRDPHHFAVLLGYGATAVYPWLAYEAIKDMQNTRELDSNVDVGDYIANYVKGINKGLLKIISKIGISTISSYRGAQLFEAIGLADDVIDLCFKGTTSRIQGATFKHLHNDQIIVHKMAFNPRKTISQGGLFKYVYGGEDHAFSPEVVDSLRKAVQFKDQQAYDKFSELVDSRKPLVLRDLLRLKEGKAIPLEEVESIEMIIKRFDSAGISMGALSPEAHESLAIAMNRLGARSNSGEGGEDPKRFGTEKGSKIKQVASGRFGVTPYYLVSAEVLQIKISQGAKPGEGGQLPGHKVDSYIGKLRYSSEGVTLISPPPHHDIYSIEDLAQLIYDLKQVNPDALVSVKLVAAPGVGTVAAGVAKTYADMITISGYDGGTGASPLTSIKYAGCPFELGLAETHQVLRANDLRSSVRVQTDGGLKNGMDVIKAAILGAESFGFGTAPMIALGCKYLRICHLNTCAVGVATQNERLRKEHFIGLPEMVINYFLFVAEEVRVILASIGLRSLSEIIGQTQYLEVLEGLTDKQKNIDFGPMLYQNPAIADKPHECTAKNNSPWDKGEKAEQMVADMLPAIESKSGGRFEYSLQNIDRSIGARISGEIAKRWGNNGMDEAPIRVDLKGVAGQSFGVWNAGGLHLYLQGDANDYVGKGMAGGKIVITPDPATSIEIAHSPIIGNTCLYGATGGIFYACGRAGERFAVRNSGTIAVVEGIGDHGCEYMTGGEVVMLGSTGLNFGAGMSGGVAWVYDNNHLFENRINEEMIELHRLTDDYTAKYNDRLLHHLKNYYLETQSPKAKKILDDFVVNRAHFWLVVPKNIELSKLWNMITKKVA